MKEEQNEFMTNRKILWVYSGRGPEDDYEDLR